MTRLNISQMAELESVRTGALVDEALVCEGSKEQQVLGELAHRTARHITRETGYSVEPDEIWYRKAPASSQHQIKYELRWEPSARGYVHAELAGGSHDGKTLKLSDQPPARLTMPRIAPAIFHTLDDHLEPTVAEHDQYDLAGWDTAQKKWLYVKC